MIIGYAVYIEEDLDMTRQLRILEEAGVEKIYKQKKEISSWDSPEIYEFLYTIDPGDTIIICRLDYLSSNVKNLLNILIRIEERGINIISLSENINSSTYEGKVMMRLVKLLNEFEISKKSQRNKIILEKIESKEMVIKHRSRGRPSKLTKTQKEEIRKSILIDNVTPAECAAIYKVSQATIYRLVDIKNNEKK